MGRNEVDAILLEVIIESVVVIGPIANEMLGVGLQYIEIETELDQGDFVMIRRVRTDGEGEPVSIHNRENLHALPAFCEAHSIPAPLRGRKGGIDELSRSFILPSPRSALANCVRTSRSTSC